MDILTRMRMEAKTKTEKTWYKMLVNALFGKFLQNNEKYTTTKVHRSKESLRRSHQSPFFKSYTQICPDLILSFERQKTIKLDKPIFMGVLVLYT